jgi:ATP synthase protein I
MTTEARASTPLVPLVRAAVLPGLAVGGAVSLVALLIEGSGGFWGAVSGTLLVTAFFATGQVVLHAFKNTDPGFLLIIALLTYALQVVVLLAIYVGFANGGTSRDEFSTKAFGVAVLASTAVWIFGLIRVAKRERIPLYDLEGSQR